LSRSDGLTVVEGKMKKLLVALFLLCPAIAQAQNTKAALTTEINTNFASGVAGGITAATMRQTQLDILNSIMPTAPVGAGNLACYSGTTGLLSDCGLVPSAVIFNAAANVVWAGPTTGSAAAPSFRALVGADLPNPAAGTLGGVKSLAAVTHNFLTSISTAGAPTQAQPAFSDLSGSATGAQLPNPSASTLGGVESLAAVTHNYLTSITTSGVPTQAQPVCADLSDSSVGCNAARGQLPGEPSTGVASAGNVGELIQATLVSASATSLATVTPKNITSISLSAGDWDVTGNCNYNGAGSVSITFVECSISVSTGAVDQTAGRNAQITATANVPGVAPAYSLPVGPAQFSVSTTQTVFLVANQTFTVGTLTGWGILRARRAR
jgi:hypothetical protein